ncbi:MAG: 3-phosphoshikimate 1-carboxyvinyltransferase [Chloroflexota bacterium]
MIRKVAGQPSLKGEIELPGDKSIAHRAVMFNAIAKGNARITNFCGGADCLATVGCIRALGVEVRRSRASPGTVDVQGVGDSGFQEPKDVLNARNSGTTMRLLAGLLSGQPLLAIITGDSSLRSRPMGRVVEPLRLMGADIQGRNDGRLAPLVIRGSHLRGIRHTLPVASAQVKSAILLAGLFADGETSVLEPGLTRDHTERMLAQMGAPLKREGTLVTVSRPDTPLHPLTLRLPGDISAAAYWLVAGVIHPKARIKVTNCGINPTRTGVLDALQAMGAKLTINRKGATGGEPVADIVAEPSQLKATEIYGDMVVRAIDEIPVLAVAACFARGTTVVRGAAELRVKETDRIAYTAQELSKMGARIEELPDGMLIHGVGRLRGAEVNSHGDHRLAMSLAIAGLAAEGTTTIAGAEAASVSYPTFWSDLETVAGKPRTRG